MATAGNMASGKGSAEWERPKMRGKNKFMLILSSLLLMGFLRTGFIFFIIAMLPAIVVYFMDVNRKRYLFKTVFACNLAGVMPYLGKMLTYGPSSSVLQDIMSDTATWIVIYGAAFVGVLMVRVMPMMAHVMISSFHQTQIMRIGHSQKRIENEWGDEVTQFSKEEDDYI